MNSKSGTWWKPDVRFGCAPPHIELSVKQMTTKCWPAPFVAWVEKSFWLRALWCCFFAIKFKKKPTQLMSQSQLWPNLKKWHESCLSVKDESRGFKKKPANVWVELWTFGPKSQLSSGFIPHFSSPTTPFCSNKFILDTSVTFNHQPVLFSKRAIRYCYLVIVAWKLEKMWPASRPERRMIPALYWEPRRCRASNKKAEVAIWSYPPEVDCNIVGLPKRKLVTSHHHFAGAVLNFGGVS